MSRLIGPKRSAIQSTGRADLGALVARIVPPAKGASDIIVPDRAVLAVVRAVGAGGGARSQNISTNFPGGGGAFAKSILVVTPGETLVATVISAAVYNFDWINGGNGPDTSLARGATILLSAKGGYGAPASLGPGGAGGDAAACIGEITRSGGNGGSPYLIGYNGGYGTAIEVTSNPSARYDGAIQGGFPASDIGDLDATNIGGAGGGLFSGGVPFPSGAGGGANFYPTSAGPVLAFNPPGPGAMIIEFYDGQVPQ